MRLTYANWVVYVCGCSLIAAVALYCAKVRAQPPASRPASTARDDAAAESLGWKLGTQAWTFRDRTLFEAIDTAHSLGLKYMQFFPGQALSKDHPGVKVSVDLSPEHQQTIKDKAKAAGITLASFGVVGFKNDQAECRKVFEFAKSMNLGSIACEPDEDAMDVVEQLADECDISVSIHNHPKPSHYWNPDTVLRVIGERGRRIGACADTGHWTRSGLRAVDGLKKLEGRIIDLHFKDIADDKDQPWGTGKGEARAMLEELHRQKFQGVILIEYEHGSGKELDANVARCVAFFDAAAREIARRAAHAQP